MATLVIEAKGFERVFAILDKLENPDWSVLLRRIGHTLEAQTIRHFEQERGPEGPWEPTQRSLREGASILVKTGRLKGSFQVEERGPYEIAVGTNVHYGKYHQTGTSRMVRRMFLGLDEQDVGEVEMVIQNYVDELLG